MQLILPTHLADSYSSMTQKIRVMTEGWVNNYAFCPNCGNALNQFENNLPVADFYCGNCWQEYELKSKNGAIGKKIPDGAYDTMIKRLRAANNPNFFILTYDKSNFSISNFLIIPKYFFVPVIIEKRKELSQNARRAGWVGCNIDISNIPEIGKIFYVKNGVIKEKNQVLEKWSNTEFVKGMNNMDARGWLLDVLLCVEKIKKEQFTLEDVYAFEAYLKAKYPSNNNIKAKIRQQLQFLRDKNILDFVSRGQYRLKIKF